MAFRGPPAIAWPFYGGYRSQGYYLPLLASDGTLTRIYEANGRCWFAPFFVPSLARFDRFAIRVSTAGTIGVALLRLGLYRANAGFAEPFTRVLDAGTVDAGSTGTKELVIDQLLDNGLYFAAVACQGAPAARPTIIVGVSTAIANWVEQADIIAGFSRWCSWFAENITGTFPLEIPFGDLTPYDRIPYVGLRAA